MILVRLTLMTLTGIVTQTIGSAFFVTAASTALNNTVRSKLHEYVPNISVQDIMIVDVTKLHDQGWLADEVASIIEAYMDGLQNAFLIAVVASGIGLLSVLGYGFRWKNLKRDGYA